MSRIQGRSTTADPGWAPHVFGTDRFVTTMLDAGVHLRDVRSPPDTPTRTTMRYDRARKDFDRPNYVLAVFMAFGT